MGEENKQTNVQVEDGFGNPLIPSSSNASTPRWSLNGLLKGSQSALASLKNSKISDELDDDVEDEFPTTSSSQGTKKHWKQTLWTKWNNIKYSERWKTDKSCEYEFDIPIIMLGKRYINGGGLDMFYDDYYSRIWITYRTNFSPFPNDANTDCGWGCMIRSTQMMMAQALLLERLGRGWRYDVDYKDMEIVKLFEDHPEAPLGVHRIMEIAVRERGKKAIGSWYSPSESLHLLRMALTESTSPYGTDNLVMHISIDGDVNVSDIEMVTKNWTKTLILCVVVRLGSSKLNQLYIYHLQRLFELGTCLGITGGRPDHSCWFVGYQDEDVIYLDPHVAHEYSPIGRNMEEMNVKRFEKIRSSYHCKLFSKMPFMNMDPSCAICFRFNSKLQFEDEMRYLRNNQVIDMDEQDDKNKPKSPIFSIVFGERRKRSVDEDTNSDNNRIVDKNGFELLQ